MRKVSWLQFASYAVSLVISLVLSLYRPDVLDVLCTALPVRGLSNLDNYNASDRIEPSQPHTERIK